MEVEYFVQAIKEEEPLEIDDSHLFEESGVVDVKEDEGRDEIVKCESCSEVYKSLDELNQHCLAKHKSQTKKCRTCSKVFANKTLLGNHLVTYHKFFQCEICARVYSSKDSLRGHKNKEHPLKCEHCEETFESKKRLVEHVSEKHAILDSNSTRVQCQKCSKFYANKESLMVHMRITHNLKCKQCGEMFPSKELLSEHYSKSHSPHEKKCHVCNEILPDQSQLENHLESLHKDLKCKECSVFATSKNSLKCHMFRHHRMECNYCSKAFQSRRKYERHLIEEHSDKNIPDTVEKEELVAEYEKPVIKCIVCNAIFDNKALLDSHTTAVHKNFQCKICSKLYGSENSLRGHMRKEHRLECEHCKETFSLGKQLVQHSSDKHQSQVRKCHLCSESLENQTVFEKHMESEHEFVKCKECGIFLTNQNSLKCHMFQYHRFSCDHCPRAFQLKRKYDQHLIEEHWAENIQVAKKPKLDLKSDDSTKNNFSEKSENDELTADDQSEKSESDEITNDSIGKEKYSCNQCSTTFKTMNELEAHEKQHVTGTPTIKCYICEELLESRTSLNDHLCKQHKYAQCNKCPKLYSTKASLQCHLKKRHPLKCEHCEETFESKKRLKEHCSEVHGIEENNPKAVQCKICLKSYAGRESLDTHMRTIHALKCDHCGNMFATKGKLDQHYKEAHPTQGRKCRICEEFLENQAQLDSHMLTKHKHIQCKECGIFATGKNSLKGHIYRHHKLKCDPCTKVFRSMREFETHLIKEHAELAPNQVFKSYDSETETNPSDETVYKCRNCDEVFENRALLVGHLLTQHKYYQCELCSKLYATKDSLRAHLRQNHIYKCEHCDRAFELKQRLIQHCAKKHGIEEKNPNSVQCQVCSKFYAGKQSLGVHMRTSHPLTCEICGKMCTTKKRLAEHYSEEHPNEERQCHLCDTNLVNQAMFESHMDSEHKSAKCKVCGIFAVNKDALKSHMYRNHRIKCEHCPKTLHSKKKYCDHLKEEHSIEIYNCDLCDSHFTSQVSLKEHTVEKHNEEVTNVMQMNEDQSEGSESDDMTIDSIEIEKYACDQCPASFDAFHELEYHKKEHITRIDQWDEISLRTEVFKGELYLCNNCNERFGCIDDLEKHSKNHIKKELDC